ncbi:MAG: restriction endonuclease subunit S, partial [Caldilineaceae bacterium]|nr:restriction endonuclease subunit S [Caldilineaceae bacterium]
PLPVPLPSIVEQNAIACILGALDDKIELNRRMNRTLEAMARALFQSWFVDFDAVRAKLALNGAEGAAGLKPAIAALFPDRLVAVDGREMPEGWKLTTLGDVTAKHGGLIQTGPFGSQLHASDYVEAGIPTIMPKDISDRRVRTEKIAYIDEADAARLGRHRVAPGDIVYSRRGDVERHALIGKREQGWLCGTGCMLVRPGARWPSPLFMSLHLDRPDIKEWITQHAIGATMPNLNTSVLGQVPILAPSHTILKAFEVLAGPLDEKSADNDRQSRTLAALRDTLLPKLISGALRVADAERIVGRCVS